MNIGSTAKNLITPNELSKLLSISKPSVYRLVDKRILPFYKIGGNLRFSLIDIEAYLSNVRVEPIDKQYERI
jgi:putative molybdopterin biosynthesis protein